MTIDRPRARAPGFLRRLAVAAAALVAACATHDPSHRSAAEDLEAPPPAAAETPLRIFATGDSHGYLDTCGCEGGQAGGVPRRGTYLRTARGAGDLRIDLGNLTAGSGDLRRLKRDGMLDALAAMAYDVVVPGRAEIADGRSFDEAARARGLRVLSANLRDVATGATVFPASWVRDLPDGRRVAVIGLSEPVATAPDGRRVDAPASALTAALADLAARRARGERTDAVIVATSLSADEARDLAADVPGVALVLSGSTPEPDEEIDRLGGPGPAGGPGRPAGAMLAVAGRLGQYVARIDFGADLRPAAAWRAWLDERVGADEALLGIVRSYKDAAAALDAHMVDRIIDAQKAAGFAGSSACASCHAEDHAVWAASLHGRAMRILVERQANRDPDCVPCHLVDVPDARLPRDADAMGVGCEACHGGSAAHAAHPAVRTPVPDGGRATCASRCHHPPEVKTFDFAAQWRRIAHGKPSVRGAAGSR